ncbi:MAG: polysaccharide deacetylase family protein [Proteobacteria bacterium]|nr:polysaccharide deacetylase family protein [Pseudomonadota bacterium]
MSPLPLSERRSNGASTGARVALLAMLLLPVPALAQEVALSFDDGLDPRETAQAAAWNQAILTALAAADVHAILFACGKRVDSPQGLELVRAWGRAGHEIANHTYTHPNFNSPGTSLAAFTADVGRDAALLQGLPGWTPRLRFPYLKEGDTPDKRDGMRRWLQEHGYASGAVSIDASDWYYDERYAHWRARHPREDPARFRQAYLEHLWDRARYYDALSQRVLGRSAAYVLLLHTRRINAEFLPDVIAMFRARGWRIISPAQAYADPLYSMQPATLPAGESILWALAAQAGVQGLRYPAEDEVYEKPILDRLGF